MTHKIGKISLIFLMFIAQIKVYHWQTKIYSRHKAADKFFTSLIKRSDQFMEVIQGSMNKRILLPENSSIELGNMSDKRIIEVLNEFKDWLIILEEKLFLKDKDLFNIRDEILADVNQTLYLFTFN
jgi:hypothetical protein